VFLNKIICFDKQKIGKFQNDKYNLHNNLAHFYLKYFITKYTILYNTCVEHQKNIEFKTRIMLMFNNIIVVICLRIKLKMLLICTY